MHNKFILVFTIAMCLYTTSNLYSQEKNSSLENYIEKKRNYNKTSKTGFSVLLYNGNEEDALSLYNSFREDYEDIEVKLTYVSPDWKVMTKAYSTKIEAERAYLMIKEKHPNAKIL